MEVNLSSSLCNPLFLHTQLKSSLNCLSLQENKSEDYQKGDMKMKSHNSVQASSRFFVCFAVLLLSAVAVFGQATFSTSTTPDQARLGGGAELVGDIALHVESGTTVPGSITLSFTTDLFV